MLRWAESIGQPTRPLALLGAAQSGRSLVNLALVRSNRINQFVSPRDSFAKRLNRLAEIVASAGLIPKSIRQSVSLITSLIQLFNCWQRVADLLKLKFALGFITLGLTDGGSAEKIERDLNGIVPEKHWTMFPHWLIFHGRRVCNARKPKCEDCALYEFCYERG